MGERKRAWGQSGTFFYEHYMLVKHIFGCKKSTVLPFQDGIVTHVKVKQKDNQKGVSCQKFMLIFSPEN